MDVISRWPGSAHDSTIFTHSNVYQRFLNDEFPCCVIVADSAYPPEMFICKPLRNPLEANEVAYQDHQIKARNVVERVNGQLKRQFPILKYGMNFHKKETAQDVIVSCAILYNMRKQLRRDEHYSIEEKQIQLTIEQNLLDAQDERRLRIQDFLIDRYFN